MVLNNVEFFSLIVTGFWLFVFLAFMIGCCRLGWYGDDVIKMGLPNFFKGVKSYLADEEGQGAMGLVIGIFIFASIMVQGWAMDYLIYPAVALLAESFGVSAKAMHELAKTNEQKNQRFKQEEDPFDLGGDKPNDNHNDEFDFNAGRFSDDRFYKAGKKQSYTSSYKAAHDPATPENEALQHLKRLRRADEGKENGIKALPKLT